MSEYISTTTLAGIASRLVDGPVLVTTHAKPDGDAFGSVVALVATLRRLGIEAEGLLIPPVPASLAQLPGAELTHSFSGATDLAKFNVIAVVDTGARSQLAEIDEALQAHLDRTVIVDHHLSGNLGASEIHVDSTSASCAEVIARLIKELETLKPTEAAGTGDDANALRAIADGALFTGVASDTGWFRFSSTTPATLRLAADLIERGVDHAQLYEVLEQTDRPQKLELTSRALQSLEFVANERAVVMVLRPSDFAETGALVEETEGLVNVPLTVESVQVVALVTQAPSHQGAQGKLRVSFRSKPGPKAVNVAELAGQFGGGGHARAAGAKVDKPLAELLPALKEALAQAIEQQCGAG